jgi:hypothetical protein
MIEKELVVYFCPLCGMDLKNSKLKIRHEHDQRYHPDYFTMQTGIKRQEFIDRNYLK